MKPTIGHWYKHSDCDRFEVVANDEADGIVEIQYEDGAVEEMDIEDWDDMVVDGLRECDAPMEDGSADHDTEEEMF